MPAERLGLALLALLVAAANLLPGETVEWRREAIMRGELWRLWSGQLCHWSSAHLAGNLAAMAAVGVIAGRPVRRWLAALPLAAPLLSLFLLVAAPALESYRGLSGLVGVLVVGAVLTGGGEVCERALCGGRRRVSAGRRPAGGRPRRAPYRSAGRRGGPAT